MVGNKIVSSTEYLHYYSGAEEGWYWEDESQGVCGPYESAIEAYRDFVKYCEKYLS